MRSDEELVTGEVYVDSNGRRLRITRIDSQYVNWVDAEDSSTGSTDLIQFSRKFHREKLTGEAA